MCGRFIQKEDSPEFLEGLIDNLKMGNIIPSFNIAPTHPILTIFKNESGGNSGAYFHWGLIPGWSKNKAIGGKMINARLETLTERPSFKNLIKSKRCLVPLSGFYEWVQEGESKHPYFFRFNRPTVFFAGLWDTWTSSEGTIINSVTLITREADSVMNEYHRRMPALLHDPSQLSHWLDIDQTNALAAIEIVKASPPLKMIIEQVSPFVNSPKNNSLQCIDPLVRT
ncbi:MAG: putative SOS response-associated peptidase YedK [Candidatus Marinamargulisbacteria bacterium]|jgi:putative SOS response-associated peptidase YedK